MKLYDLQKEFIKIITPTLTLPREYTGEGTETPESGFSCSFPRLRTLWGTGGKARMGVGLQIYRDSSINSRFKALRNVFPGCECLVGEQFFWRMAMEFLQQPSGYLSADAQGEQFPDFINHYKAAVSVPYLSDLAKLEWCWYQVFHGPEGEAGAKTLTSIYPVTQLWEMCQPEYAGDFVLQELKEPLKIMIIQREQRIYMLHL